MIGSGVSDCIKFPHPGIDALIVKLLTPPPLQDEHACSQSAARVSGVKHEMLLALFKVTFQTLQRGLQAPSVNYKYIMNDSLGSIEADNLTDLNGTFPPNQLLKEGQQSVWGESFSPRDIKPDRCFPDIILTENTLNWVVRY